MTATNIFVAGNDILASQVNANFQELWDEIELDYPSGENLSAGDAAYVNTKDGSLYKSHGYKEITSATTFTQPTTISTYKSAKLSDTQFMCLYDNGGNTLSIAVFDRTAPTTAVATQTVSTTFGGSSTTLQKATMCRMTDTTFIVFYTNTTNDSLRFRTGSISGGTITMGTDTAYTGSPTYCYGLEAIPGESNGTVVFGYQDDTALNGNSGTISCVLSYLAVASNSVTVTYTTSYNIVSGAYYAVATWTNVCYTQGIAYGLFCTADAAGQRQINFNYINVIAGGTTSNNNKTINLESQTGAGVASVYSQYAPYLVGHDGKGYFGYATSNNATGYVNTETVLEISQSGCNQVFQHTTVKLGGDNTSRALPLYGGESGFIINGIPQTESGATLTGALYFQKGKIFAFQGGAVSDYPAHWNDWYQNLNDEIVFVSNGSTIKTWRLPTPFDGFVKATVTAPASAIIYDKLYTTTGLTAFTKYFLKDTYTNTGEISTVGIIPVGRSLSTTRMKVEV